MECTLQGFLQSLGSLIDLWVCGKRHCGDSGVVGLVEKDMYIRSSTKTLLIDDADVMRNVSSSAGV